MDSGMLSRRHTSAAWLIAAVYFVVFALPALLSLPGSFAATLSVALLLVAIGMAAVVAYRGGRFTRGKERRMWRLLSIASALFFVGVLFRAYHVLTAGSTPSAGSIEDVAFILGLLAFVPVVLLLTEPYEVIGLRRLRNGLDFLTMVLATFAATYSLLIVPFAEVAADHYPAENFLSILYAVVSLSFVLYLVTFKREKWLSWERSLLAAAVSGSCASALRAVLAPFDLYHAGSSAAAIIDGLLGAGFILIAVAGLQRLSAPPRLRRNATPLFDLPHWPGAAAMMVGLVSVPLLIFAASAADKTFDKMLISTTASLIAALIVARSAAVGAENRRLARLVPSDPLTGLGNMTIFRTVLDAAVCTATESDPCAVIVFDVDLFDSVNSTLGYSAGDDVLRRIARELQQTESHEASAFRIGGDAFALIMLGTSAVDAYETAAGIATIIGERSLDGIPGVSISVGIAAAPAHSSKPSELARLAEGASYHAKTLGGGQIVIFDRDLVDVLDATEHIAKLEERTHSTMVESLAAAVDARDPYTQYHSRNVAQLALFFARELGLPTERVSLLHSAGLLHDVGKIGVPDSVLKKKGPLTPEERSLIETHPDLGVKILHASVRQEILPWVHAHHERIDGKGYPQGLVGEQIPFEARLLAVCDAFDAMTTDRPYRAGLSIPAALNEMRASAGTQLDGELVELFLILISEGRARDVRLEPAYPNLRLPGEAS